MDLIIETGSLYFLPSDFSDSRLGCELLEGQEHILFISAPYALDKDNMLCKYQLNRRTNNFLDFPPSPRNSDWSGSLKAI